MSSLDEFSKNILVNTLLKDNEIKKEQKTFIDKGDVDNALRYYAIRRQNFQKISELSKTRHIDLTVQAYLNQHRGEMELELKLYDHQNEINRQIAEMTSKVDSLEQELVSKDKRIERLEKIIDKLKLTLPETE
jgi:predicted RNase H-like nuclease (RuvC/YqgF family)